MAKGKDRIDEIIDEAAVAAHKATEKAAAAAEKATAAAKSAAERSGKIAEEWKTEAGELAEKAGSTLKGAATTGKDKAADAVHSLADATRSAAGKLGDGKTKPVAEYAAKAADGMERFSDTLKNKSVDEMGEDFRTTVRDHPVIAVGAAAIIGFALARFLKSSPRNGHDS